MAEKTTGKLKLWLAKITDKISDTINTYLPENFTKIDTEFSSLKDDIESHLAENVTQADGAHGLKIETGTWTPVLNRTGAVYSQQYGHYIRIGNIVFCVGRIVLSSKGTSSLGTSISGLPFPVADTDHRLQGIVCKNITLGTGFYNTVAILAPTSIYVFKSGNTTDWLTSNDVQDNSEFYINILYRIA